MKHIATITITSVDDDDEVTVKCRFGNEINDAQGLNESAAHRVAAGMLGNAVNDSDEPVDVKVTKVNGNG